MKRSSIFCRLVLLLLATRTTLAFPTVEFRQRPVIASSSVLVERTGRILQSTAESAVTMSDDDLMTTLTGISVIDPQTGEAKGALEEGLSDTPWGTWFSNKNNNQKSTKLLLVIGPQLGDFDTFEYAELLAACLPELKAAKIDVRYIGIGNVESAKRFSAFSGLPLENIRIDPTGSIHRALQLHGGPDWDIPSFVPRGLLRWFAQDYAGASAESDEKLVARAWLNYMAMCAGIAAPDTLPEIMRGYLGDKQAPERLAQDEIVTVGDDAIVIRGTTDVKLGPIQYQSLWKDARGYQRPAELATVRLRGMVEVLTNFNDYVPDQTLLHLRGATFLLDSSKDGGGQVLFSHRDTGVLAYSTTMARPLSFLEPYIGPKALNPLGLGDTVSSQDKKNSVL